MATQVSFLIPPMARGQFANRLPVFSQATTAMNSNLESAVGKVVYKSEASPLKWLSATPPVASPVLAPASPKAGNDLWVPQPRAPRIVNLVFNKREDPDADNFSLGSLKPLSIRRGPVLRHDRLQHSETMASTRRAMDPLDEEHQAARDQMRIRRGQVAIIYSYLFLLLSSIAFACLATTEFLFQAGTIPVLTSGVEIVVGIVLSGSGIVGAIYLILWTTKKHRRIRENPIGSTRNSWIELHHREHKPLPPLPSAEKNAADENNRKVRAAFEKFIKDTNLLRRYLYGLEEIILRANGGDRNVHPDFTVVHDILALAQPQSTTTGRAADTESTPIRRRSKLSPSHMFSNVIHNNHRDSDPDGTVTPKASSSGKKVIAKHAQHASKDPIPNATLLKNDSAQAEASVPQSATYENILAELCDGVTATTPHRPPSGVIAADSTSRRSSRDQSDIASISGGSQRRWSRRGYANLDEVAEPSADPYNSENYRRKGKGRAD